MTESIAQIALGGLQLRVDTFLVLLTVVLSFIAFVVAIVASAKRSSRSSSSDESIVALLSKPEALEALRSNKGEVAEVIKLLREEPGKADVIFNPLTRIIDKISKDIQWDIAGVIGVGVTMVLLFMVVSGTIKQVPDQLFTGWLMILGYYFGKGTHSAPTSKAGP